MVFDIGATDIPDGGITMPIEITDPQGGTLWLTLSHLGVVLLATAGQRSDGALVAPVNLRAVSGTQVDQEIERLLILGLAARDNAQAVTISALGRAALETIDDEG